MNTQTMTTRLDACARHSGLGRRLLAAVTGQAGRAATRMAGWHRRRAAIRELSRLSDRQLRDVGIERNQIVRVVDGLVRNQERKSA